MGTGEFLRIPPLEDETFGQNYMAEEKSMWYLNGITTNPVG